MHEIQDTSEKGDTLQLSTHSEDIQGVNTIDPKNTKAQMLLQ